MSSYKNKIYIRRNKQVGNLRNHKNNQYQKQMKRWTTKGKKNETKIEKFSFNNVDCYMLLHLLHILVFCCHIFILKSCFEIFFYELRLEFLSYNGGKTSTYILSSLNSTCRITLNTLLLNFYFFSVSHATYWLWSSTDQNSCCIKLI